MSSNEWTMIEILFLARELLVLTGFLLSCYIAWRYGRQLLDELFAAGEV